MIFVSGGVEYADKERALSSAVYDSVVHWLQKKHHLRKEQDKN